MEIVGVSGDAVRILKYFDEANDLNFTLLSDVSGKIAGGFGVPLKQGSAITRMIAEREETLHRAYTPSRWTFIIDKSGKIINRETEVDAASDSRRVIDFIKRHTDEPGS